MAPEAKPPENDGDIMYKLGVIDGRMQSMSESLDRISRSFNSNIKEVKEEITALTTRMNLLETRFARQSWLPIVVGMLLSAVATQLIGVQFG